MDEVQSIIRNNLRYLKYLDKLITDFEEIEEAGGFKTELDRYEFVLYWNYSPARPTNILWQLKDERKLVQDNLDTLIKM